MSIWVASGVVGLAALAGLSLSVSGPHRPYRAKPVVARLQIKAFREALASYQSEMGSYPSNAQGLAVISPRFISVIPTDPWGRPYVYKYPGDHGKQPDIVSHGADGQPGGGDDIVSWEKH